MVCLGWPRFPFEQCQLAKRCVGLAVAFVNILKYLVFRRSHPPGGRMLARRVSASNIIKRKRQAEVAGILVRKNRSSAVPCLCAPMAGQSRLVSGAGGGYG